MQDVQAIVLESPSGLITGWDDNARALLGYSSIDVVGRPLESLLSTPAPAAWHADESSEGEVVIYTPTGSTVQLSYRRSHLRDQHGSISAIATSLQRVATSPSLRAELEGLLETLPGALLSYRRLADGHCCFPHASSGAVALFGFEPSALRANGAPVIARIHEEDREQFRHAEVESARTGGVFRCEFRYDAPSLGERWLAWHALPAQLDWNNHRVREISDGVKGASGEQTWVGICLDITLHKRTEADLARVEAQLSSALEAANMGAWIFDADTGKVWGNRQQRELWETPADAPDWYEKSQCLSQMHEEDRHAAFAGLMRALEGEPLQNEFRLVRSDGSIRWIAGRARAEVDARGRRNRVAGVNVDITQRKLVTEKALRSQKLEALGTLASGIAHDFNNVLFVIMGNADVALVEAERGGDTRPMLRALRAATERAADLIQHILAFSRPTTQATQVIALGSAVQDALAIVRATTPAMIEIRSNIDPSTPGVWADGSRIGQVIINLCTNAAHAIGLERTGTIEVNVQPVTICDQPPPYRAHIPPGSYAQLSVNDDGCGMDAALQSRIFDPFFTTKRPGEGSGLGLAMVHKIALALGAHIAIESARGKGSRFEIYFPPAAAPQTQPAQAPSPAPLRGQGQRIVFIDDEQSLAATGAVLLRTLGYEPTTFCNPAEALAAIERDPHGYSVVVTDLTMPAMSGLDVARRILALRPDLPVVLTSGSLNPDAQREALRIGVRETLTKPSSLATLAAVLSRLFDPQAMTSPRSAT